MTGNLLRDAFDHHVWATIKLIDACIGLSDEQLAASVPGIYGSVAETMGHTVGGDRSYLLLLSDGRVPDVDEASLDLPAMRRVMEENGPAWAALLDDDLDPGLIVTRHRDDGTDSHAPLSIRLAQVIHHGTDHRSQICTILTSLGIEPPAIDVWDYGREQGRISETRREA